MGTLRRLSRLGGTPVGDAAEGAFRMLAALLAPRVGGDEAGLGVRVPVSSFGFGVWLTFRFGSGWVRNRFMGGVSRCVGEARLGSLGVSFHMP